MIAPLNWGLGHASRCIPIIKLLQEKGAEVIIAAEGRVLQLLKHEFPNLEFVEFRGLKIKYPKNGALLLHFALRLPQLFQAVKKENLYLKKIVREHKIDGIISDNRYGVYHKGKPSVIITHQLFIESPIFKKTLENIIKKLVTKFGECWIPDFAGEQNLSGSLSHKKELPVSCRFIGTLSRFNSTNVEGDLKRQILVMLSGPEPQRSILEEKLKTELIQSKYSVLMVRGVVEETQKREVLSKKVETVNFLNSSELEKEINASELVICRSGYSSVMDLVSLKKNALLIPTPGQTEQEYLARYLSEKNCFTFTTQDSLALKDSIKEAMGKKSEKFELDLPTDTSYLDEFLAKC